MIDERMCVEVLPATGRLATSSRGAGGLTGASERPQEITQQHRQQSSWPRNGIAFLGVLAVAVQACTTNLPSEIVGAEMAQPRVGVASMTKSGRDVVEKTDGEFISLGVVKSQVKDLSSQRLPESVSTDSKGDSNTLTAARNQTRRPDLAQCRRAASSKSTNALSNECSRASDFVSDFGPVEAGGFVLIGIVNAEIRALRCSQVQGARLLVNPQSYGNKTGMAGGQAE